MTSEHFINASDSFYEFLCMLFRKCLLHGYMPAASTLIPIHKDNNVIQRSDKYWVIALSAIGTKLFEYIILSIYGDIWWPTIPI